MSFEASAALQAAIYQALRTDPALTGLVGDAVYDAMPATPPTGTYVAIGPEDVSDAGDMTGRGARHDFIVSVLSGSEDTGGFGPVKEAAAAVMEALEDGARGNGNLLALAVDAARAKATVGEISDALEAAFGRHVATVQTVSGVYAKEAGTDSRFARAREMVAEMGPWLADGRVKWKVHVDDGLDGAVDSLNRLFTGDHDGKLLVRVSEEPA